MNMIVFVYSIQNLLLLQCKWLVLIVVLNRDGKSQSHYHPQRPFNSCLSPVPIQSCCRRCLINAALFIIAYYKRQLPSINRSSTIYNLSLFFCGDRDDKRWRMMASWLNVWRLDIPHCNQHRLNTLSKCICFVCFCCCSYTAYLTIEELMECSFSTQSI